MNLNENMSVRHHRRTKAVLLAGITSIMAGLSAPAMAQQQQASEGTEAREVEPQAIVITGSRIVRRDYTATSPIVTVDQKLIEESSAVNIEANLNKLPQFAPALTQFDTQGLQASANTTIGIATVSLRQLGANRNLVLIDGRRPTPINGSGVVDINTIPSAAIERVEVITGGASSTYGADAVGGVVNFILRRNFQGLNLDGQYTINERGDGAQYRASMLIGASMDNGRGNVMMGLEYYNRDQVRTLDRPWYQDLARSPNIAGTEAFLNQNFISFPAAGQPTQAAFNTLFNAKGSPAGVNVPVTSSLFLNGNNTLFLNGSTTVNNVYTPLFYGYDAASSGAIDGYGRKMLGTGVISDNIDELLLSSPQSRYSFFAKGRYELNDWLTVNAQMSYASTETMSLSLNTVALGSLATPIPWDNNIYTGNAAYGIASSVLANGNTNPDFLAGGRYGLSCPATGGCTNKQVFPVPGELATLLNSRTGAAANQPYYVNLVPGDLVRRTTQNKNQTFQMLAGLEGTVPGTDMTWEIFASHGETTAKTDLYGYLSVDGLKVLLNSPNFGKNFRATGNSLPPGSNRNGAVATCASGLSPFIPTNTYTADCGLAISVDEQLENRLVQEEVQANLQGGLFNLPYGQMRFAVGADYRLNKLKFHADSSSIEGSSFFETINGTFPQGSTRGSTSVKELYGELLVPLLSKLPFAEALNLELGYRHSDYASVGPVGTYKFNGEYAPVRWMRFRGGYQKASRAPNLGELFTARTTTQSGFNDGDPCSRGNTTTPVVYGNYSANTGLNTDAAKVEAICRTLMGVDGANQYYRDGRVYPTGAPSSLNVLPAISAGAANLKEEDATTYTIGAVITSPFESPWLRGAQLSIDYYNVVISGGISLQGVDSVSRQCFSKIFNPNYDVSIDACQRNKRDAATGERVNVTVNFTNAGRVETSGWDVQFDWGLNFRDVGIPLPGRYSTNIQFNYLNRFATTADERTIPLVDYAGSTGGGEVGTNAGSYRWKLFSRFNYAVGPATISLQWQFKPTLAHVSERTQTTTTVRGAPSYHLFSLSGSYAIQRGTSIRFGIDNLFDKAPPLIAYDTSAIPAQGRLPGGRYDAGNYDVLGRRFYIGASIKL